MKMILSPRRHHHLTRVRILLVMVALTTGLAGCSRVVTYEIHDWYDLDSIRHSLGINYLLMNDLDSSTAGYEELASPIANGGKGWQPIGMALEMFRGLFDGRGYEITDLFINRPDEERVGLFAQQGLTGIIRSVGVVNATVIGSSLVGSLVGYNHGTVSNSYFTGNVSGTEQLGGLIGYNEGGSVSNSYSSGNVTGSSRVGGVVGQNMAGNVSDSYSTSSVAGYDHVGGLVGLNEDTVSNCFWDIETSGQAASDGGTGKTTAEMKNIATFAGAGWNIIAITNPGTRNRSYIWNIVDGETYPFLSWQ